MNLKNILIFFILLLPCLLFSQSSNYQEIKDGFGNPIRPWVGVLPVISNNKKISKEIIDRFATCIKVGLNKNQDLAVIPKKKLSITASLKPEDLKLFRNYYKLSVPYLLQIEINDYRELNMERIEKDRSSKKTSRILYENHYINFTISIINVENTTIHYQKNFDIYSTDLYDYKKNPKQKPGKLNTAYLSLQHAVTNTIKNYSYFFPNGVKIESIVKEKKNKAHIVAVKFNHYKRFSNESVNIYRITDVYLVDGITFKQYEKVGSARKTNGATKGFINFKINTLAGRKKVFKLINEGIDLYIFENKI